jgi:hypothetical protein
VGHGYNLSFASIDKMQNQNALLCKTQQQNKGKQNVKRRSI